MDRERLINDLMPGVNLEEVPEIGFDDEDGPVEEDDALNAFGPENAPGVSLIVLMRIYDVLMALLRNQDAAVAKDILEKHSQGLLLGPSPWTNGVFITDVINAETEV